MDRLAYVFLLATAPAFAGGAVIVVLAMGYYFWPAMLGAALIGLILSGPAAYIASRKVKRDDPDFDHRAHDGPADLIPDPDKPER